MIIWNADVDTNGTSKLGYVDLSMDMLDRIAGMRGYDGNGYVDDEKGYDGWQLSGTFNGAVFTLYTRYGVMRIGGRDDLDVAGLEAALMAAATAL
jgi:hypothetical protein